MVTGSASHEKCKFMDPERKGNSDRLWSDIELLVNTSKNRSTLLRRILLEFKESQSFFLCYISKSHGFKITFQSTSNHKSTITVIATKTFSILIENLIISISKFIYVYLSPLTEPELIYSNTEFINAREKPKYPKRNPFQRFRECES